MQRDEGRVLTDEILIELEREIRRVYAAAGVELMQTIDEHFAKFADKDKEMQALLNAGKITDEQYKQWRLAYMGRGQRFEELRDKLAERVTRANEVALAYVNDRTPTIYTLNRNYAAYSVEKASRKYGSFTLFDEATVRRLIVEKPDLMPYYPEKKALEYGIDLAYGKKQITAAVTSGILQGKGTRKIAADLRKRLVNMSVDSALRTARTAVTAAENGGREDTFQRAADMGIKVKYQWVATLDARTRLEHGHADGQVREQGEPFDVGGEKLLFPGDKSHGASGWNIYNCRCAKTIYDKYSEKNPGKRRARNPVTGEWEVIDYTTYDTYWETARRANPEAVELMFKKVKNASSDRRLLNKYKAELGSDAPRTLDELQEMKYTKPEEWEFFKAFAHERRKERINSTVSVKKLREVYERAIEQLVGQTTSDGIEIKHVSVHFAARVIGNPDKERKGVSIESCLEAMISPVRADPPREKNGEISQRYWTIGTTVSVNPITNTVVQCNPNHRKRR